MSLPDFLCYSLFLEMPFDDSPQILYNIEVHVYNIEVMKNVKLVHARREQKSKIMFRGVGIFQAFVLFLKT